MIRGVLGFALRESVRDRERKGIEHKMYSNHDLVGLTERNYQLQRLLYRYRNAGLWEAANLFQQSTCWVLVFDRLLTDQPLEYSELYRSMEMFASLKHPHLLGISEYWNGHDQRLFVALDPLSNAVFLQDLRGQMAPGEMQYIFSELVGLIEWANDWGLVLDLRPDQIFVRPRPFAFRYLLLPKSDSLAVLQTQPDVLRVESRYLSPEEIDGWPKTKASVYFTLGTILYETLTGRDAFLTDHSSSTMDLIRQGYSPALQDANLNPTLDSLFENLMRPSPEHRLRDSKTVRALLREAIGRSSWSAQGTADASLISVPKVQEQSFDESTTASGAPHLGKKLSVSNNWLEPPQESAKIGHEGKPLFQAPDALESYSSPMMSAPSPVENFAPTPEENPASRLGPAGSGNVLPPSPKAADINVFAEYPPNTIPTAAPAFPQMSRGNRAAEAPVVSEESMTLRMDELQRHRKETPHLQEVKVLRRKGVVRHFSQMNPNKVFPLLVSIIEAEMYIKVPELDNVQQVESEKVLEVKESSPLVRLVPVVPGCLVSPPEAVVDVRRPKIDVTFWVAPQAEGDFRRSARVEVWHEGVCQDAIPIPCLVRAQTITKVVSAFSLVSSVSGAFLEAFVGKGQALASGPKGGGSDSSWAAMLAKQVVVWLSSSGLWLGCFFLLTAFLCYLWLRPRKGDLIERFLTSEIH